MARDPRYQRLLNSKEWKELRVEMLRLHPICEECERLGFVRASVDCHHRIPISSAMTEQEMRRLCFDPNNIQCLCVPCHIEIHKAMGKNTKANMQARAEQRLSRWSESIRRPANPGAPDLVQTGV